MLALWTVAPLQASVVLPELVTNLVCFYDFEHPVAGNPARERDLGFSGTDIDLINGGAAMRTNDGAYGGSTLSLQTQQVNPTVNGNDDWKAGLYLTNGITSLSSFSSIPGITLMGWVKPTGTNPNLNSFTPATNDFYGAMGLFGVLSGSSEGHVVRALLEVVEVSGTLRLIALGRRIDGSSSLTLAATNNWHVLLPDKVWTHLAATFDFDNGTMVLYRNGVPVPTAYSGGADPWGIVGGAEPDVTSVASPTGIKIGGSYPQNSRELNAFNGRFDDLMFFNRVLTVAEVQKQFANFPGPALNVTQETNQVILSWPLSESDYALESRTNLEVHSWIAVGNVSATNGDWIRITVPNPGEQQFFRLRKL